MRIKDSLAHVGTQALRGVSSFRYQDVFEQPNKQPIKFRKVTGDFVSTTKVNGKEILHVRTENREM
jgi:hypothetical protein